MGYHGISSGRYHGGAWALRERGAVAIIGSVQEFPAFFCMPALAGKTPPSSSMFNGSHSTVSEAVAWNVAR